MRGVLEGFMRCGRGGLFEENFQREEVGEELGG